MLHTGAKKTQGRAEGVSATLPFHSYFDLGRPESVMGLSWARPGQMLPIHRMVVWLLMSTAGPKGLEFWMGKRYPT